MIKHTAGPWWPDIDHSQGEMRWGVEAKDSPTHPHYVAFMPSATEADEANARLIASAPELLEAAEKACTALDAMMGDTDVDDDESLEFQAMQALNAAIAKAKGEAQ